MKKTKFLALVLVAAIALMGAGYAWWTDTLVVDSTVNTGYLDVDFTNYSHVPSSEWVKVINHTIKALEGDGEDYPNGSRDNVILTIKDMYPGSFVTQKVTLTNVGTMPVNVSEMVLTATDDSNTDTLAMMHVTVNDVELTEFENGVATVELAGFGNPHHGKWGHRCTSNCCWNPNHVWHQGCPGQQEPEPEPDPDPDPEFLEPGESQEFEIVYKLDELADDDITENQTVTFELTVNCTQYNYETAE